ncbi:MAG: hypothetical protein IKS31_01400 [Clostridia bacterium]|nr:hypothetical protein [Clostridia bacterium]
MQRFPYRRNETGIPMDTGTPQTQRTLGTDPIVGAAAAGLSPYAGETGGPAGIPPMPNAGPQLRPGQSIPQGIRPGETPAGGGMDLPTESAGQAIGREEIEKAREKLKRYMNAKASLDERITDDEDWWRLRHWQHIRSKFGDRRGEILTPKSAWLLNSIMNKHADAMDNYPSATVLPRAEDDIADAQTLTQILPVVLEANDFEAVYDRSWWTKLKTGTRVIGVFWDSTKENGAGDISIREVDVLNLFWEPGIRDIQESDAVFCLSRVTLESLKEQWGDKVRDITGDSDVRPKEYRHDDQHDRGDETTVVDWYYKKRTESGKTVLHLCKFCGDVILFASENTDETGGSQYQETGWYEDGSYPFVFDALYPVADSICGFGEVDIMRDPQMYIDKMDAIILRNALLNSKKRYFANSGSGLNEEEFADWDRDIVHVEGSLDETQIREIGAGGLDQSVYAVRQNKIDELKETSGNRDFSQGGSSGGITAASAIAALQEAGSKLSRDMIKASYRSFVKQCILIIERIRQFYDEERTFRITGEQGEQEFVHYSNAGIAPQTEDLGFGLRGERRPVFDLKVKSEKNSPFSRISQNELAKELFGAGVFNPQLADQALMLLDMMDFEGVDQLKKKISERGTMFDQMAQQIQALQQQVLLLGEGQVTPAGMDGSGPQPEGIPSGGGSGGKAKEGSDPTRDAFQGYANTRPDTAARRARQTTEAR